MPQHRIERTFAADRELDSVGTMTRFTVEGAPPNTSNPTALRAGAADLTALEASVVPPMTGPADEEMTIDVLARRAGITTRSVRAYRTRRLLPAPRLVGRVGWYDCGHLARLREIGLLLRRGYPLAVIGELLSAFEDGRTVRDLLGLE